MRDALTVSTNPLRKVKVLAPLSDFPWDGESFLIPGLCSILKRDVVSQQPECQKLLSQLHEVEQRELGEGSHWLVFDQAQNESLSEAAKINIFLLALWLVAPTRARVRFRFELSSELDSGMGHPGSIARMLDQFQFIGSSVHDSVSTEQIEEVSTYVAPMRSIFVAQQRLWNGLVLTLYGCMAFQWQVAFICFSAAAEGILTYKKTPKITKRLAKSFACLTNSGKLERDSAYRAFAHSYDIRSDIMHGRAGNLRNGQDNLKELGQWSDLLRLLWKTVLASPSVMSELEKSDTDRERYFIQREANYEAPTS